MIFLAYLPVDKLSKTADPAQYLINFISDPHIQTTSLDALCIDLNSNSDPHSQEYVYMKLCISSVYSIWLSKNGTALWL